MIFFQEFWESRSHDTIHLKDNFRGEGGWWWWSTLHASTELSWYIRHFWLFKNVTSQASVDCNVQRIVRKTRRKGLKWAMITKNASIVDRSKASNRLPLVRRDGCYTDLCRELVLMTTCMWAVVCIQCSHLTPTKEWKCNLLPVCSR